MPATVILNTVPTLNSCDSFNISWSLTGSGPITLAVLTAAATTSPPIVTLVQNTTVPSKSFLWHPVNLSQGSYILQAHGQSSFTYSNVFKVEANLGSTCELVQPPLSTDNGGSGNEPVQNTHSKELGGGTKVLIAILTIFITIFLLWILLLLMKKRRELRPKHLFSRRGRLFLDFGQLFVVIGRRSSISDSQSLAISTTRSQARNPTSTSVSTEAVSLRLQTSTVHSRSPDFRTLRFENLTNSTLATGSASIKTIAEELTFIDANSTKGTADGHRGV